MHARVPTCVETLYARATSPVARGERTSKHACTHTFTHVCTDGRADGRGEARRDKMGRDRMARDGTIWDERTNRRDFQNRRTDMTGGWTDRQADRRTNQLTEGGGADKADGLVHGKAACPAAPIRLSTSNSSPPLST